MANLKRPIRRNALIGPWGVGAIVPFPNDESLMIAGLDMWRYSDSSAFVIKDERLQKRLGVQELRWPPDYREKNMDINNYHLSIPAVRFPTWFYCPYCGSMKKNTDVYERQPSCDSYPWSNGRVCNPSAKYKKKMIPERFIVICPEGHIDDFPVAEWLHFESGYEYNPNKCRIRRSTGGASSSLSGVFYECTCGAKQNMSGVTRSGSLKKIGYKCKGARPWLGQEKSAVPCDNEEVRVVLRGATNVWFADTRSSIYIPVDSEKTTRKILEILDEYYDKLSGQKIDGEWNRVIIDFLADQKKVDSNELYKAFLEREQGMAGQRETSEEMSEDEYRFAEYKILIKSSGSEKLDFYSRNFSIDIYDPIIKEFFTSVSLVHKLKETRALVGFSRCEPKDMSIHDRKKMMRLGNESWLPAIQVHGEGIFFEFNKEKIDKWANNPLIVARIKNLQNNYRNSKFSKSKEGDLRAEYLLLHTFAHLIINQLSYECGYGSSSIRERIYCEKTSNKFDMYGVLIYTASGDSEGSLGGLVRQGKPGYLENTIKAAMMNASWCSSDPVCIQSLGQGPESCNLAACHNCAVLPETCCENGNRLLDRGVVIGTLEHKEIGFFADLCNE